MADETNLKNDLLDHNSDIYYSCEKCHFVTRYKRNYYADLHTNKHLLTDYEKYAIRKEKKKITD